MTAHRIRRRRLATSVAFVAFSSIALTSMPADASAQSMYASPELGVSKHRGPAAGARVGLPVFGGLDLVAQGLVFFPDEEQTADPGVAVDRSLWHASLNAIYVFDRSRAFAPYVGVGGRYGRSTLSIVVDGLRARAVDARFSPNVLGGVRLPRLPGTPFVEYRSGGGGGWVLTAGGSWTFRGSAR